MKINAAGFRPFTITIETEEEAKHLLVSLNTSIVTLRNQKASSSLLRNTNWEPNPQVMGDIYNALNVALGKML
jgi:hypothetical protein